MVTWETVTLLTLSCWQAITAKCTYWASHVKAGPVLGNSVFPTLWPSSSRSRVTPSTQSHYRACCPAPCLSTAKGTPLNHQWCQRQEDGTSNREANLRVDESFQSNYSVQCYRAFLLKLVYLHINLGQSILKPYLATYILPEGLKCVKLPRMYPSFTAQATNQHGGPVAALRVGQSNVCRLCRARWENNIRETVTAHLRSLISWRIVPRAVVLYNCSIDRSNTYKRPSTGRSLVVYRQVKPISVHRHTGYQGLVNSLPNFRPKLLGHFERRH